MDSIFSNLGEEQVPAVEETEAVETVVKAKSSKEERVEAMKAALKETILTDPTFKERKGIYSDSLEVLNTLGFGEDGGVVRDKSRTIISKKTGKEIHPRIPISKIVGYRVKNVGDEAIKYQTGVWAKGDDGIYAETKTEKTLEPGDEADFTRLYITMLCAQPEISFRLANGKIIRGAGADGAKDIKEELASHYFAFSRDKHDVLKQVHDDTVKLAVGEKIDGEWVVKEEFEEVFGFLNNPEEKARAGGKPKERYSAQDVAANYINKMIEHAGL